MLFRLENCCNVAFVIQGVFHCCYCGIGIWKNNHLMRFCYDPKNDGLLDIPCKELKCVEEKMGCFQ